MSLKIAVVYHSGYGHTDAVADKVAEGARSVGGVDVLVIKELPVQVDWSGKLPENLLLESVKLAPERVRVVGGSRILEEIDRTSTVPGALVRRDRGLAFTPDAPWAVSESYRLVVASGCPACPPWPWPSKMLNWLASWPSFCSRSIHSARV